MKSKVKVSDAPSHKSKKYIWLLIAVSLFFVLVAVSVRFFAGLRGLYGSGIRPTNPFHRDRYDIAKPMLRPERIEGWMTFEYINFVFRLPADYLSGYLNITDSGYPNITLDKYADTHGLDKAAFVALVKQEVGTYLSKR